MSYPFLTFVALLFFFLCPLVCQRIKSNFLTFVIPLPLKHSSNILITLLPSSEDKKSLYNFCISSYNSIALLAVYLAVEAPIFFNTILSMMGKFEFTVATTLLAKDFSTLPLTLSFLRTFSKLVSFSCISLYTFLL